MKSWSNDLLRRVASDATLPGEQRLLLAVIGQACRDARLYEGHRASAMEFLLGEGFECYARALGFDPDDLMGRLVRAGELPAGVARLSVRSIESGTVYYGPRRRDEQDHRDGPSGPSYAVPEGVLGAA